MADTHTHEWTTRRSGGIEFCACGKWRFSAAYLATHPAIVEIPALQARETWTIAKIADANARAGFFFFSRETMRFFGDTRASFRVKEERGRVFIVRRRAMRNASSGYPSIPDVREFDPATGRISEKREFIGEFFATGGSAVQS